MNKRITVATALIAGPTIWLCLFFIIPLLVMALFSLRPDIEGSLLNFGWTPTLKNYQDVVQNADYIRLLFTSLFVAFIIAFVGVLLAYPLAYFLTFRVTINRSL